MTQPPATSNSDRDQSIDGLLATATLSLRTGRIADAQPIITDILARHPDHAPAVLLQSLAHHAAKRYELALQFADRAVALSPDLPDSWNARGLALTSMQRYGDAIPAFARAISMNPSEPNYHSHIGIALCRSGRTADGFAAFQCALAIRPDHSGAHYNLANALLAVKQFREATEEYRTVLALDPNSADAHFGLGSALAGVDQLDSAIEELRRAIALRPNHPPFLNSLGIALCRAGRAEESIAAHRQAVGIAPYDIRLVTNLGTTLCALGRLDEGIATFRRVLALKPDLPEAHWNIGGALLLQGNLAEGWPEYEWRWKLKNLFPIRPPRNLPQWDGSDLKGKRIFLFAEQGLGDAIMFSRYIPLVAERGARVTFACGPELHRLMQGLPGIHELVGPGDPAGAFGFECALMSLPLAFGTTLQTIPASKAYLSPMPELIEKWRKRVPPAGGRKRVGLVWAGNPKYPLDGIRSMALADLAPLVSVENVWWCSLQKGPAAAQAKSPPAGLELTDWTDELTDMADTAGLIANLDLVISVDTSMAHLAGAIGQTTWVVLPHVADWKWLKDGADSPWYPSARLFRQADFRDWRSPVEQIVQALR